MQHSSAHQTLHTTTTSPHTKDWLAVHGGDKCPLKSKSSRGKQLNALSSSVCVKLRICADTIDEFLPHLHKRAFRLRKRGVECTRVRQSPRTNEKITQSDARMIYVSGSNAIFHGPSVKGACVSKCLDLSQTMRCWFCGRARMGWHHVRTRSGPKNYLIESIINLLAAFNCQLLSRPHAACVRESATIMDIMISIIHLKGFI